MKITRTSEPTRAERASNAGGAARTTGTAAQPATSAAQPSTSAHVQLSDLSNRLSQLESQFSGSSFDAGKVSEIRSAIADGRYQVNAGAIADKLLASAAQLAGRKA
ncbi:MAG TPA: flagellar biosynthesis anti-sigma factor FlgM [Burkholderiaceae bacterium]|jgi:negative regulator of flagellin synthesis FlgM|nr:flagellar biosynthesis anti-sigma factor FlgM [Burkholderiaceae bacterium]